MSDEQKAIVHGELLDDGSYHCRLSYPNDPEPVQCHAIEWSRSEFVEHLREAHQLNVSERRESGDVVIDGEPALIVHRGVLHDRVEGEKCSYHSCLREKAFADAWEQAQQGDQILARLSSISVPIGTPGAWRPVHRALDGEYRACSWAGVDDDELYSQRDATVAATVVQWLGTNVGFSWLEETLKKAGYRVELHDAALARAQLGAECDQWRRRAQLIEQERLSHEATLSVIELCVDNRLSDLALAALSFASTHISNEADLFEKFCEARLAQAHRFDQVTSEIRAQKAGGSNGLRSVAIQLRDTAGALGELRAVVERWQRRRDLQQAQGQPQSPIGPETGSGAAQASS